jgi:large subunit ribosomal protein L10
MSTRTERTQLIEKLEQEFSGATGIYLADNNKITVEKVTKLRVELRKKGMKLVIVKNSLAKAAAKKTGKPALEPFFKGPTAVLISKKDATAPAKVIKDFQKDNKELLTVKAAYVDGDIFYADDVVRLAEIPSREVLLAQLLGCLKAPMGKLAAVLAGIPTKLVRTLDALKEQKSAQG